MKDIIKRILEKNFLIFFIIYYITLFIETTSLSVDYPILEQVSGYVRYLTYIFFIARFFIFLPLHIRNIKIGLNNSKKFKLILLIGSLSIVFLVINYFISGDKRLFFTLLVMISAIPEDYKKIFKTTMMLQISLTAITVMTCVTGVTQNYIVIGGGRIRNSLGFCYTTNLAQMILFSSILWLYGKDFKASYVEIFLLQILNAFMFFITDSRTEFIFLEVLLIYVLYLRMRDQEGIGTITKKMLNIFAYIFPVFPLLSLLMVLLYPTGGIFIKLNNLLSNRLAQTYSNIQQFGIGFFGKGIEFIGYGLKDKLQYGIIQSNFIDNEYIQMIFNQGLLFTICFISIIYIVLIMLHKKHKYAEIFVSAMYLMFAILNPRLINILYCPLLFMIIPVIRDEFCCNKIIKEKNN